MEDTIRTQETTLAPDKMAEQSLFIDTQESRTKRVLVGLGVGVVATTAAYAFYRTGLDVSNVLDAQFAPEPPVYPEIVDGFVVVNETLRTVGPPILAGGIVARGIQKLRAGANAKSRTLEELSGQEYTGTDIAANGLQDSQGSFLGKVRERARKFSLGIGVASLAVLLTGGSSGVEHEVSNGPIRPVEQLFDALSDDESDRFIITQSPNTTFMDDSYISTASMAEFVQNAEGQGINAVPFSKTLPNIDGRSGLLISLPDQVFEEATNEAVNSSCADIPILLDEANTTPVGGEVTINGIQAQVADKLTDTAQMNRDIAVMSETDFNTCIKGVENTPYFAAVASGDTTREEIEEVMTSSGLGDAVLLSEERFKDNNRRFWRANGTPILLQLIAYVGVLSAFAIGSERRGVMQRNIREIGTLNAAGVPMRDIRSIEMRRALRETGKATLIAAPLMPVMAGVFNMAMVGLKVGVGLREIAVGYSITLAAKLAGSVRAVHRFSKKMDLPEAVKG